MCTSKRLQILFLILNGCLILQVDSKPLLNELFHRIFGSPGSHPTHTSSSLKSDHTNLVNYTYPRIWLTVSPVVEVDSHSSTDPQNTSVVRALELHWEAGPGGPQVGDFLELYYFDPTKMTGAQASPRPVRRYLLKDDQNHTMPKYIKTDVEFPYMNTSQIDALVQATEQPPYRTQHGLITGRCLHYYLVYLERSANQPKALNCIQLNARWMQSQFALLSNHTLEEIMLPGTHDATSYEHYRASDYETNVITRFQYTQDENLYAQLAYGIRYLDMRVGAYNQTVAHYSSPGSNQSTRSPEAFFREELWMVHDIQRNHISMRDALKQVKRFLERTTHEVIIVDFHRFVNGFDQVDDIFALQNRLRHFYRVVVEELGPFLIPFSSNRRATIGQLVREGKRVMLGYAYKHDPRGLFDSDLFWPAVEHLWANTDQMHQLEQYLKHRICQNSGSKLQGTSIHLRSAMAELTPSIEGILFLKYHGLRELAQLVNLHYDNWFRARWWKCANIVGADFFLGSDLVQIAVDVNRRRFTNASGYETDILVHQ